MADTRDRIITATHELFRAGGYNGTSLKQISRAAGAPIGSVYHFFPSGKSELAEAVVVETGAVYRQLFELIADAAESIEDGVADFFSAAADTLEESGYIDVCPIGSVAREVANTDDRIRRAADSVFASWVDALSQRLRDAGLSEANATGLAETVVATLEGGFMLARTSRDGDQLRRLGLHMRNLVHATISQRRGLERTHSDVSLGDAR